MNQVRLRSGMIKVAVIGVGNMGRHHARVYREMAEAELAAVADTNAEAVEAIADLERTRAYTNYKVMLDQERPEAVTVAVPTQHHYRVVMDALSARCHVLVEKPIAATVSEGLGMIAAAREADRVLMVGHIERYNPAILELKHLLDTGEAGDIFQVHSRRIGPFPDQVKDVGVIIDLATHDLDVMRYLVGREPVRVCAESRRHIHTLHEDLCVGTITFENGVLGLLEIGWLTPTKIRELYVTTERGLFVANYLTQDLCFYENAEANGVTWDSLATLRGVSEGAMTRYAIRKREPLRVELEAFLSAAKGEAAHVVSGEDGVMALDLALKMIESAQRHAVLTGSKLSG